MIVVTQENPGGNSRRYGSDTSLRNARRPEFRSGIVVPASHSAKLADHPLRRHPQQLVGALLARARPDYLVDVGIVVEVADQFGDPLVRIRHVRVGPDDDLAAGVVGADPTDRPRAAIAAEGDDPQLRVGLLGRPQSRQRLVGRLVVDRQQLVGVAARVERDADPGDLLQHVVLLVITRQDDSHIRTRRDDAS